MEHPCIPKDISPYLPQLLWNLGCIPPPPVQEHSPGAEHCPALTLPLRAACWSEGGTEDVSPCPVEKHS